MNPTKIILTNKRDSVQSSNRSIQTVPKRKRLKHEGLNLATQPTKSTHLEINNEIHLNTSNNALGHDSNGYFEEQCQNPEGFATNGNPPDIKVNCSNNDMINLQNSMKSIYKTRKSS
jgi:hypothetical protein